MSSSTSNSKSSADTDAKPTDDRPALLGRRKWLVVLVLLGVFGALEVVTRQKLFAASKDLSRFTGYRERAKKLGAATGKRIAFVGNSLTDRAVDPTLFGTETRTTADLFVADASHVNTWFWIIDHEFWKQHVAPELIIISFYENGLEDGKRLEIGRLAQFFTERQDWPELFQFDVTGLEPRLDFVLSSFWATYAVRDRIKDRALGLIPGYKDYSEIANGVNFRYEAKKLAAKQPKEIQPPKLTTLQRLLERAKLNGTHLLFVAFPSQIPPGRTTPYDLPPETLALIARYDQAFIDLRVMPELLLEHYADDIHLTEVGKGIYTRRFAAIMRERFPALFAN